MAFMSPFGFQKKYKIILCFTKFIWVVVTNFQHLLPRHFLV